MNIHKHQRRYIWIQVLKVNTIIWTTSWNSRAYRSVFLSMLRHQTAIDHRQRHVEGRTILGNMSSEMQITGTQDSSNIFQVSYVFPTCFLTNKCTICSVDKIDWSFTNKYCQRWIICGIRLENNIHRKGGSTSKIVCAQRQLFDSYVWIRRSTFSDCGFSFGVWFCLLGFMAFV